MPKPMLRCTSLAHQHAIRAAALGIQRSGLSPERLRRLHRALQGYVERGEIAGIVALIHRHGEEAHVETLGWQDKEAQIPIRRNTLFRIMSMTKPIIAAATLLLVEEGRLRLYDPSFAPREAEKGAYEQ